MSEKDKIRQAMQGMRPWFLRQDKGCQHLENAQEVTPSAEGCEECLQMGDSWVHLRLCLICGHVGCCDLSKNKHATSHFHTTGHPVVRSFEPGENWIWCYVDEKRIATDPPH